MPTTTTSADAVHVVRGGQDPAAVDRLLRALPDWFGIEESIREYVDDAARLPTYRAVTVGGEAVGVALVAHHTDRSAEIHLMAVAPDWHRRGVGRLLVTEIEHDLRARGVVLLEVKTQGPSLPTPGYADTQRFYEAVGFIPLEEMHGLWPEVPCLVLVKPLL